MSKVYTIKTTQIIPSSPEHTWAFFSSPENLVRITPAELNFRIISKHHGDSIYNGQIIEYRVSPMLGISMYWMTEITQVDPLRFFIDEQRFGPYSFWHHQHHFKTLENGVEMTDIIHYKLPMGWLGDLAQGWFVKNRLQQLFEYRRKKIIEIFGES